MSFLSLRLYTEATYEEEPVLRTLIKHVEYYYPAVKLKSLFQGTANLGKGIRRRLRDI